MVAGMKIPVDMPVRKHSCDGSVSGSDDDHNDVELSHRCLYAVYLS